MQQELCPPTIGDASIADSAATRANIESRSLEQLVYAATIRHWIRQGMIGNRCSHCGYRPEGQLLRKFALAID
jgi:hypothetical protein